MAIVGIVVTPTLFCFLFVLVLTAVRVPASPLPHLDDHAPVSKRLPSQWYHRDDHPVNALFKRAPATDGLDYAPVGSPAWSAEFPRSTPDSQNLPRPWVDALNAAIAAGKIPDIPQSRPTGGNPVYPQGVNPNGNQVCSTTYKCRGNPDVLYDAPDGVFGISFDDGPLPTSRRLYDFLEQNNEHATHFFIGVNILSYPDEFTTAFDTLQDDIAVHTWTHPYMTTLSNLDVLAQLAWTMEIIHNSTGGRVPQYWRPPYGDSDNRVVAIAKEVLGLTTVIWNQDTADWSLGTASGTTPQAINRSMTTWLTGPKHPGLMILEHELSDQSVQAFMDAYPVIKRNGWTTTSVARMGGGSAYANSPDSAGPVDRANGIFFQSSFGGDDGDNSGNTTSNTNASSSMSLAPSQTSSSLPSLFTAAGTSTATSTSPTGTSGSQQQQAKQANDAPSLFRTSNSFLVAGAIALLSAALLS